MVIKAVLGEAITYASSARTFFCVYYNHCVWHIWQGVTTHLMSGALDTTTAVSNPMHQATDLTFSIISVIPFGGSAEAIDQQVLLLLNTVFSLVRFGGATKYIVAATTTTHLNVCLELNLPCYNIVASNFPGLVLELLDTFDFAHVSQLGTTYNERLIQHVESDIDILHVMSGGDIIVRASDAVRSVLNDWALLEAKSEKIADAYLDVPMFKESNWEQHGSKLRRKTLKAETICPSQLLDLPKPFYPRSLIVAIACTSMEGRQSSQFAVSTTIDALKQTGLWQLSTCTNKKYCDIKQSVPMRWLASPPDLGFVGKLCQE
ncbi:hypothetical protein BT63DRAFT_451149 [Microthyrium microscopicum]|uniref:Uncharacterized protein n=1 Tax=Microthyrium microscopicum TaxID=703497 RepID=A0A6A6UNW5_9PEZI|nr:hypothetical protein BT63DRAFT_451149 [Microthyrium microscopicum]